LSLSTNSQRIKLVVSYDGTDFCGWAAQTGQRTVQSTLTEAVRRVTGEEIEIYGASRTDSGAHALGQTVHFDCAARVPLAKLPSILNRLLPLDLRAVKAEMVSDDFNSRFSANHRHYRYSIIQDDSDPFRARFAYIHQGKLNLAAMKEAGKHLVGKHDFRAFTEELPPELENTWRELFLVEVNGSDGEVLIDIEGTAFMRGMMRRIAGFLLEVGRGHRTVEDAGVLLGDERESLQWPVVLPARGLCLVKVDYSDPEISIDP
jgi:tRNA pseudouridine38-40 synthase